MCKSFKICYHGIFFFKTQEMTTIKRFSDSLLSTSLSLLSPEEPSPSTAPIAVSAQSGDHHVRRRVLEAAQLAAFPPWPRIGAERRRVARVRRAWSHEIAPNARFSGHLVVRSSSPQLHLTSRRPWLPRSAPVEARIVSAELETLLAMSDFVDHH